MVPSRRPPSAASGSAQDGGDEPRTRAAPEHPLDARGLRTAYLTLLGRPPYEAERERWGGRGLLELLDAVLGTIEAWRHWLDEQLYYFLLVDNFRPASEAVSRVPDELAAGRLDVREALHRIALSPSFDLRNPGADTFVTVVMEQLVGSNVQESPRELELGKSAYEGKSAVFLGRTGACQADVVRIAVESREASRHFLAREHRRLLLASAAPKELVAWTRTFHAEPESYLALVCEWLHSPRWTERLARREPVSNRMFVRALYVDLLGRAPEDHEAEPLRSALDGLADSRPLRGVLVRLLLDSGQVDVPAKESIDDPTAWVAGGFRRLLGREPAQDELATYVSEFHEPACRPETVLLALLSDPDYHRY